MRCSTDAAKTARLRAGEISDAEAAVPPFGDPELGTLSQLRVLDERVEEAGFPPLICDVDRRIVDSALEGDRIDCAATAAALGIHRSTVFRRVKRLLANSAALHRRGATFLGEAKPQPFPQMLAMAKTLAWDGIGDKPDGALDIDQYNRLAAMYRAGFEAGRLLSPPSDLTVKRCGDKLIITGPGPLHPVLQEAVRTGKAERIFPGTPHCRACGRFVSRPSTGRPPKFCSERCRSRYRRRS